MPPDRSRIPAEISRLASGQQRQIAARQLLELGTSTSGIKRRADNGYLHRTFRGVYSVGCPARLPAEFASAAVLACGDTAALDRLWAIALWDFAPWPSGPPQVVVTSHRSPGGIDVRHTEDLPDRDRRIRHGIPVTSPARAILDAGPLLSVKDHHMIVNRALRTPRLTKRELIAVRAAHPRHPGAHLLDWFIRNENGPSRAWWESVFPEMCVARGLCRPRTNVYVWGFDVDAVFDDARLVVELDGWRFHNDRDVFESDRERDAELLLYGYSVLRITWRRLKLTAARELTRLGTIIDERTRLVASAYRQ